MFGPTVVINAYARNLALIQELTAGFSHADSLVQPPAPGNCANWIIGHIAAYRNRVLTILEQPLTLDEAIAARYARDSKPVLGEEPGIGRLETLIAALVAAQPAIAAGIDRLTPESGARVLTFGQFTLSTADWMIFLLRHEAYHTGQLELLREVVNG
jgi:hypothetical protein